ncbi:hypothetical protein Dpoa2040_000541 [Dickeya sp. CFBP 2040]|uniref:hypothetical protein n=1 Tax=Dickeya sp. CFBP 2040 TaxID=2718531 RepID=UPI00144617A7|nr:hypothetical protein [Dickeya sp. CFBP 2040]NKI73352.1 hypothetical protein [Dickeya sp. CFBP 2040]
MNMKPLFLGVILAASYAHAASTEITAKPVTGAAASAEVKTTSIANTTASQGANGKALTASLPQTTAITPAKQNDQQAVKAHQNKKVMHKKAVTAEKEPAIVDKTGKEPAAEHKITAEKKKNTIDEKKATTSITSTSAKTE